MTTFHAKDDLLRLRLVELEIVLLGPLLNVLKLIVTCCCVARWHDEVRVVSKLMILL